MKSPNLDLDITHEEQSMRDYTREIWLQQV